MPALIAPCFGPRRAVALTPKAQVAFSMTLLGDLSLLNSFSLQKANQVTDSLAGSSGLSAARTNVRALVYSLRQMLSLSVRLTPPQHPPPALALCPAKSKRPWSNGSALFPLCVSGPSIRRGL